MTSGASVRTVSQVHKAARQMVAPKPPGATKGISFSSQRNKRAAAAAGASSSKTPELPAVSTSAAAGPVPALPVPALPPCRRPGAAPPPARPRNILARFCDAQALVSHGAPARLWL